MEAPERIWILLARKFSDSITEAEDTELEQLLRHHSDAQYTFEILEKIWDVRPLPASADADLRLNQYTGREAPENKAGDPAREAPSPGKHLRISRRVIRAFTMAASVLLIAGALFTAQHIFSQKPEKQGNKLYTISAKAGGKEKATLPDGTQVWLNAASSLSYRTGFMKDSVRQVTLTGEAYFDVKHDKEHPFVIHTRSMDIRDIGTVFNVKAYPGDALTEATLISGAIEVTVHDNTGRKIRLKPKEKIVVYQNKHFEKYSNTDSLKTDAPVQDIQVNGYKITPIKQDPAIQTFPETAWMQNDLVFKDQPFEELVKMMERKYAVKIVIKNNYIKKYRLTGIFRDETIEQALTELKVIAPFKYSIKGSLVTVF